VRITEIEALHLRLPEVRAIADGTQDVLVVRVRTDEGIVGHGEVVSSSAIARAVIEAPLSAPRRHGLAAVLIGKDPLDPPARWDDMYDASRIYGRQGVALHAMSGIDTALWDIVGQAAGKPLCEVWGQRRDRVRAYASTLFPDEPQQAAAMTRELVDEGFTAIKFGWGSFGSDRRHDHELLEAITTAAGDTVDIMVDVGRCWPAAQTIDRGTDLFRRFNLTWLEDPLPEDDLPEYHLVTSALPGRISTGEMESTVRPFKQLLEQGVQVVQPDAGRAGGLTTCRQISDLADRHGAWCIPHCFGTGILLLASLQWMAAAGQAPFIEYPITESPLREQLVRTFPHPQDGWLTVPDAVGLGIELDDDIVDLYRVA
jgi:L-rhamnonate dehydratase